MHEVKFLGLGRCPGEGNGNPLQDSCLENPVTEEPGRLQSMGWQRVGHDRAHTHTHTLPSLCSNCELFTVILFKPVTKPWPFAFTGCQGDGFSCGHVWMWELDCEEGWAPKNWCFWTVVLEKTLENTLDCKEIQLVHPKGDQSWIFIGRTDAEAETPVLLPGKSHG